MKKTVDDYLKELDKKWDTIDSLLCKTAKIKQERDELLELVKMVAKSFSDAQLEKASYSCYNYLESKNLESK